MTDLEIGRKVREIVSQGNNAEVKMNKDKQIIILDVRKKIVGGDNVSSNQKL